MSTVVVHGAGADRPRAVGAVPAQIAVLILITLSASQLAYL